MPPKKIITGFSKLNRHQKHDLLAALFDNPDTAYGELKNFIHPDLELQQLFEEFSENTVTNFFMPYGIAPNVKINDEIYHVPMVTEESSVVAAASAGAKFWASRGGFHSEVVGTVKLGQVHFLWNTNPLPLVEGFGELKKQLVGVVQPMVANMEKRGGGLLDLELVDMTHAIDHYYQLKGSFDTRDSMGANLINSCMETCAQELIRFSHSADPTGNGCQVIMSILSNYAPDCRVKTWVECPVAELHEAGKGISGQVFAEKFDLALRIAKVDPYRAVTHNKGIFNGIDAVALATGNDFRALEAGGHTWASRDGAYQPLTQLDLSGGLFNYSLEIPLTVGSVGGLTRLHPMARFSLSLLDNPPAERLMQIISAVGLANNFSAIRSLVTTGIQHGHMKMHIKNILNFLKASPEEKASASEWFTDKEVSYKAVSDYLRHLRLKND